MKIAPRIRLVVVSGKIGRILKFKVFKVFSVLELFHGSVFRTSPTLRPIFAGIFNSGCG